MTFKFLLCIVAMISVGLWFGFTKSKFTISLPGQGSQGFVKGGNLSIIHKTKGTKTPVFYVKNAKILDVKPTIKGCEFKFRATSLTRWRLGIQGYE